MKKEKSTPAKKIETLSEDVLGAFPVPHQVEVVATHVLEALGATAPDKAVSTKTIIDAYRKLRKENADVVEINENSFGVYLSPISHSESSAICCEGRKKGYYLALTAPATPAPQTNTTTNTSLKQPGGSQLQESDLYPIFKAWLTTKGYCAQTVANKRGQGKWQNTDIIGIRDTEIIGTLDIEIASIEVKLSKQGWETQIFEAVAHKMFANRAYFAFMCKEDEVDKVDDMKLYAEKFGIGILALAVDSASWDKPKKILTCPIREIVPAPYDTTFTIKKKEFLDAMGITNLTQYNDWKMQMKIEAGKNL